MTIDSSWISCFKEEAPDAFTKNSPFHPKAVFCDGQIRLMRGHQGEFTTWDTYIWQQFHAHVKKFYEMSMVSTVILAFDDYTNVPQAKCMTQIKRRRHLPKLEILEREPLPPFPPSGEKWDQCIANRTFKSKVIALVIRELPRLLNLREDQSLIVDYAGSPVEYKKEGGEIVTKELTHLHPMGEADVKFTRYAEIYRDLLVDSVDGDSIPIALLFHETCLRDLTMGSMLAEDLVDAPPRISIYRITTRMPDDKKRKDEEDKKRKADEKESTPKRTFEYVNIDMLYLCLKDVFQQCMGRMTSPSHSQHLMSMLLVLIGITGTDFTRSMPQVSGKTVFGLLPDLWVALMRSYDTIEGQVNIPSAIDYLVSGIYASKFSTHFKTTPPTLSSALLSLQGSKLSQRTRDSLPTVPRVHCTLQNVNWLIKYWREPTLTPNPLEVVDGKSKYGFVLRKGLVGYSVE